MMNVLTEYWKETARVDKTANELRAEKIARHGSIAAYLQNLRPAMVTEGEGRDFDDFYQLYSGIFTLPEEREEPEGFARALATRDDQALKDRYGAFDERIMIVRDPDTGAVVGGINYIVMARGEGEDLDGVDGMAQLNYLFVDERYRKMGIGSWLVDAVEKDSRNFIRDNGPQTLRAGKEPVMIAFCEQNAPLKMTAAEYLTDNRNALIDQCDRLGWWQSRGYLRMGMNYVQPPLEEGGEPCTSLTLNAKIPPGAVLTDKVAVRFLNTFFDVSVLKGEGDISTNPDYRAMKAEVAAKGRINVFDDRGELPEMKRRILAHLTALEAAGQLTAIEDDERTLGTVLAEDGQGPVHLTRTPARPGQVPRHG